MNPWARRPSEALDRYTERVQQQDVLDTIDEAREAVKRKKSPRAMILLLLSIRRLTVPDDPRDIRMRRSSSVGDGPTQDRNDV